MHAVTNDRDYREHPLVKRQREAGTPMQSVEGIAMTGLPDALIGHIAVVFSTLFVEPERVARLLGSALSKVTYETPAQAYTLAMRQLDYYHRLADESAQVRLIERRSDLDAVLATWTEDKTLTDRVQGMVILMENGDPIIEPRQFEAWYERGVRIVGPAWAATRYSGGTREPGGLTPLGEELLEIMAGFNALLDVSHMAEEAFYQALDQYQGQAIIASHSNPRKFRDTDRHLSDDMIRRLAERDGVMGIVPYNLFLSSEWRKGDPKSKIPITVVIDAIDHVCQVTGSVAHVGIGTDFDGGFGAESTPDGLDFSSDLIKIADGLKARGFAADDITAIMSANMLRKLRQALPV